jgi:hypothetical protein
MLEEMTPSFRPVFGVFFVYINFILGKVIVGSMHFKVR